MSIFLLPNWQLMNSEILPILEDSENAIEDLYPVLLDTYLTVVKDVFLMEEGGTMEEIDTKKREYWDLVGAANDIGRAREEFYKLPLTITEKDAINISEGYYYSLSEYDDNLADEYKGLLRDFLIKYNIRYCVSQPCKLILTIEGLLATEYDYIKHLSEASGSDSMKRLIKMLQNHLVKIDAPDEENHCIANCIKLIEHFILDRASERLHRPIRGRQRTLGYAIKECPDLFPSESVKESLKKYYDFTNEYPNIRHVGEDACVIRDLNKSDALLALSLSVSYSAFIIQNYEDILDGNYVKISGEDEI